MKPVARAVRIPPVTLKMIRNAQQKQAAKADKLRTVADAGINKIRNKFPDAERNGAL